MIPQAEWSRSRFWLCHFLNSRRERIAPASVTITNNAPLESSIYECLGRLDPERGMVGPWLMEQVVHDYAHDPAYIQSLRLLRREKAYHRQLLHSLLRAHHVTGPTERRCGVIHARIGRWLGDRFVLSMTLLTELIDLPLLEQVRDLADDPGTRTVCDQLTRDLRAHIAFRVERLMFAYADFNFFRRNLRRLRLRGLFAALLLPALLRQRHLATASGQTCRQFITQHWAQFTRLLEQMVPYRRDALLAALLQQRQQPYAKSQHAAGYNPGILSNAK